MSERRIYIKATKERPQPLTIKDTWGDVGNTFGADKNFVTEANPFDIIRWVSEGDITSFSIEIDSSKKPTLFQGNPIQNTDGCWSVIISPSDKLTPEALKQLQEYTIKYKVGDKDYTQDPKIQIHKGLINEG